MVAPSQHAPVTTGMPNDTRIDSLLAKIDTLTHVVATQQRNMQAVFSYKQYEDLREYEDRVNQSEINSGI